MPVSSSKEWVEPKQEKKRKKEMIKMPKPKDGEEKEEVDIEITSTKAPVCYSSFWGFFRLSRGPRQTEIEDNLLRIWSMTAYSLWCNGYFLSFNGTRLSTSLQS